MLYRRGWNGQGSAILWSHWIRGSVRERYRYASDHWWQKFRKSRVVFTNKTKKYGSDLPVNEVAVLMQNVARKHLITDGSAWIVNLQRSMLKSLDDWQILVDFCWGGTVRFRQKVLSEWWRTTGNMTGLSEEVWIQWKWKCFWFLLDSTCTNTIGSNRHIWIWQLNFKKLILGGKGEVCPFPLVFYYQEWKRTQKKELWRNESSFLHGSFF